MACARWNNGECGVSGGVCGGGDHGGGVGDGGGAARGGRGLSISVVATAGGGGGGGWRREQTLSALAEGVLVAEQQQQQRAERCDAYTRRHAHGALVARPVIADSDEEDGGDERASRLAGKETRLARGIVPRAAASLDRVAKERRRRRLAQPDSAAGECAHAEEVVVDVQRRRGALKDEEAMERARGGEEADECGNAEDTLPTASVSENGCGYRAADVRNALRAAHESDPRVAAARLTSLVEEAKDEGVTRGTRAQRRRDAGQQRQPERDAHVGVHPPLRHRARRNFAGAKS